MTRDELFEEVRLLIQEPQDTADVDRPAEYNDAALLAQARSAMRQLRAKGVLVNVVWNDDDFVVSDNVGMYLAYRMAANLLSGDVVRRLKEGELGIYFRAGTNVIDTREVGNHIHVAADEYEAEAERVLMILLTDATDAGASVVVA
jgi:hypothetical protein